MGHMMPHGHMHVQHGASLAVSASGRRELTRGSSGLAKPTGQARPGPGLSVNRGLWVDECAEGGHARNRRALEAAPLCETCR